MMPYPVRMPEQQWEWLKELIETRNPNRIAINQAEIAWAGDGLTATLKEKLEKILDPNTLCDWSGGNACAGAGLKHFAMRSLSSTTM